MLINTKWFGSLKRIINFAFQSTFKTCKMTKTKPFEDISEIRNMMERASRFISLSGLAGVFAGLYAIIGATIAYWYFNMYIIENSESLIFSSLNLYEEIPVFVILLAALVFIFSVSSAVYFTTKNSKNKSLPLWDNTTKKLLISLFVPLLTGGIFILFLISRSYYDLIVPSSLIFYGLALLNGAHFTYSDIRYLAYFELAIGIISLWFNDYAIIVWAVGFGFMHIAYGTIMYFKYEK